MCYVRILHACTYLFLHAYDIIYAIILTQYGEEVEHRRTITTKRRKLDTENEKCRVRKS